MKKALGLRTIFSAGRFLTMALVLLAAAVPAFADDAADQMPASVEAERAALEAKFNAILSEECSARLCTPVGCEISTFRTLDQKQNSSLPGLDLGDDQPSQLQYKMSSARCDFTYEPMLAADAVANLRERVQEKIRTAGVSLSITGRKLNPASPALRETAKDPVAPVPVVPPPSPWAPVLQSLPTLLIIAAITAGLLALIWAFRRLGKPKPLVVESEVAADVDKTEGSSAVELIAQREALLENFRAHPELATATFEPLVREAATSGSSSELARVLSQFGPTPLESLASRTEYRDVFARVRRSYAEGADGIKDEELGAFLKKVERLVSLARLGTVENSLEVDLQFLGELAPDEFFALASELSAPDLLTLLSFAPESLRSRVLKTQDDTFRETFARHLLSAGRLSEKEVRKIAHEMKDRFVRDYMEIKNASPAKLPLFEQLMNSLDGNSRRRLLTQVKTENPAMFERLLSETLLEKALVQIPAPALNDVFLNLDPDEAAAYLGSHPDQAAILARLKGPLAQSVESRLKARYGFGLGVGQDVDFVSDENSSLANQARQKVQQVLKRKSASGELNLRRLNEAVVGSI